MPQTNICIGHVFVTGNRATIHHERCVCKNRKNQTVGTRDCLATPQLEVKKGLLDK